MINIFFLKKKETTKKDGKKKGKEKKEPVQNKSNDADLIDEDNDTDCDFEV